MKKNELLNDANEIKLYEDVCSIIDDTRYRVAADVNSETCLMNWHVGAKIKNDILQNERAEYGKQVLKNLSKLLVIKYGNGWGYKKLQHCLRAAYTFSEDEIAYAVPKRNNRINRYEFKATA